MTKLTPEILTAAIEGFEAQKNRIEEQIAELRGLLSGDTTEATATPQTTLTKRKAFSVETRRKMAMAQQARYAKLRGASEPSAPVTPEAAKPKRVLSAAGREAIAQAARRRWAAKKSEAPKAGPALTKKAASKSSKLRSQR